MKPNWKQDVSNLCFSMNRTSGKLKSMMPITPAHGSSMTLIIGIGYASHVDFFGLRESPERENLYS